MLSRFPRRGLGMKVFRKTWPENCFWEVHYDVLKKNKPAKLYGIKFWNGEMMKSKVEKIPGANKRGIWQYDMNDTVQLSPEDIAAFEAQEAAEAAEKEAAEAAEAAEKAAAEAEALKEQEEANED